MRNPPNGVQFQFEMDQLYPVALATLKEDAGLRQMRFKLVPTKSVFPLKHTPDVYMITLYISI